MPTPRDSYDAPLDTVYKLVVRADRRSGCKGSVGIGILEMPETEDGALYAASVPVANGKPLCTDLSACLDRDARLGDDTNCFALSGAQDDEFIQCPLVMGLILGIGVDDGLIFNSKPITGKSYITSEFGHMRLLVDALTMMGLGFLLRHCGCGQHGCIENYLSDRGFAWLYQHYYHRPLQALEIIAFYDQGDEQARAHVKRYLDSSAVCLGDTLIIVGPDLVVIGGGLLNFPAITTQLAERLPRHLLPVVRVPCTERTRHGDMGGMRGAAFLHLTD